MELLLTRAIPNIINRTVWDFSSFHLRAGGPNRHGADTSIRRRWWWKILLFLFFCRPLVYLWVFIIVALLNSSPSQFWDVHPECLIFNFILHCARGARNAAGRIFRINERTRCLSHLITFGEFSSATLDVIK